jgi:hypothetical protein
VLAAGGTPIGPYDVLIAGQAKARELILVTHNTAKFGRVSGLRLERLRNLERTGPSIVGRRRQVRVRRRPDVTRRYNRAKDRNGRRNSYPEDSKPSARTRGGG